MCSLFNSQQGTRSVIVQLLDNRMQTFDVPLKAKGSDLLELVFQYLQVTDTEYFGLQYMKNKSDQHRPENFKWMKPIRILPKAVGTNDHPFFFTVMIYVPDPSKFRNTRSIHQYFLQVAKDMAQGKLQLPSSSACLLASYVLQAKLGDYSSDQSDTNYVSNSKVLPNLTKSMEYDIRDLHKQHRGQSSDEAEFRFLDNARHTDMYGVQTYAIKNSENRDLQIGVGFHGMAIFENLTKKEEYHWSRIQNLTFIKDQFKITLLPAEKIGISHKYKLETVEQAKSLLESSMIQHIFYVKNVPSTSR